MQAPELARDQETCGLLAEAEALILGQDKASKTIPKIP